MTPFDPRLPIIAAAAKVKTCHVFHCWQAMREMGPSFHKEAFAQFTGLEVRHVERIIQALAEHSALPGPKREISARGTRLPLDWTLPDDWRQHAVEQRKWHPDDIRKEAAAFAGYWQTKAGQGGVKLDWRKVWQNWVRNSHRPDGDYVPVEAKEVDWLAHCKERLAWAQERDYQPGIDQWGAALQEAQAKAQSNVIPLNRAVK